MKSQDTGLGISVHPRIDVRKTWGKPTEATILPPLKCPRLVQLRGPHVAYCYIRTVSITAEWAAQDPGKVGYEAYSLGLDALGL